MTDFHGKLIQVYTNTHLSIGVSGSGLGDVNLGQGDGGPAMSGDDVLVSATLSPKIIKGKKVVNNEINYC